MASAWLAARGRLKREAICAVNVQTEFHKTNGVLPDCKEGEIHCHCHVIVSGILQLVNPVHRLINHNIILIDGSLSVDLIVTFMLLSIVISTVIISFISIALFLLVVFLKVIITLFFI